jgi:hypothetical protein
MTSSFRLFWTIFSVWRASCDLVAASTDILGPNAADGRQVLLSIMRFYEVQCF